MRLLIIGSLGGQVIAASKIAIARGAKVAHVDGIDAGLTALRSGQGAELVMADVKLDIERLILALRAEHITVPVVAAGVGTNSDSAVAAIRAGAKEYIPLPPDPELIAAVLEAVTEDHHALIYRDPAMERLIEIADQIAASDASVLITGESGTGKELLARYLHNASRRSAKPFVSVNCAAIPENLLESELFGHEKGAFTGAVARRLGKFEQASGSTLLLDEISELDLRLQAKLLRALQEREIDRVGGIKPIKVNIRVIATSNRDMETAVSEGKFREDLFYRLNVVNLRAPALRERPADIDLLARHFAKHYADTNDLPRRALADDTVRMLRGHPWHGNVRELENCMHRAVLLAKGDVIQPEDVILIGRTASTPDAAYPDTGFRSAAAPETTGMVGKTVAEVERDLILHTLRHYLGNRTHAATILGISIRTLRNKLKLYSEDGVAVPVPGESSHRAMV
ncbi:MAG: sigma 54-interacting transcriptional regulator [Alphaproteobacteria bacterium]